MPEKSEKSSWFTSGNVLAVIVSAFLLYIVYMLSQVIGSLKQLLENTGKSVGNYISPKAETKPVRVDEEKGSPKAVPENVLPPLGKLLTGDVVPEDFSKVADIVVDNLFDSKASSSKSKLPTIDVSSLGKGLTALLPTLLSALGNVSSKNGKDDTLNSLFSVLIDQNNGSTEEPKTKDPEDVPVVPLEDVPEVETNPPLEGEVADVTE